MSEWRRRALDMLPEHERVIADAWSPMALWIELRTIFSTAAAAGRMEDARQIIHYARYCLDASAETVRTAAAVAFVEHLADEEAVRDMMPGLVTSADIANWRPLLLHHADPAVVDRLELACKHRS